MLNVQAGDVISVTGNDRIPQLGAHGGFMGHVLVVLSKAQRLPAGSPEGSQMCEHLKMCSACDLWKLRTLESTRSKSGLHFADLLLRYDDQSGRLILVGELSIDSTNLSIIDSEAVDVWQSPPALRNNFRLDLMEQVVADMKDKQVDWSFVTAAWALLSVFHSPEKSSNGKSLQEIQDSWDLSPICTTVVIVFWQRYLLGLANESNFLRGHENQEDSVKMILQWMPLNAYGVLPGTLTKVLCDSGWVRPKSLFF